jgi:hypothetical protein
LHVKFLFGILASRHVFDLKLELVAALYTALNRERVVGVLVKVRTSYGLVLIESFVHIRVVG